MDDKLSFSWDPKKAEINLRKHKVSFEEASSTFYDEFAKEFDDPDHSQKEERYLLLGISRSLRVLAVSFCYRSMTDEIRIISARKADKDESRESLKGRLR